MLSTYFGEIAALLTALFWSFTAISFELAGKRIGSLLVNILRLFGAFILLSVFSWIYRGVLFPTDATAHQWIWLSISGLVGLVLGDYFLIRSLIEIGARISLLITSLVPPIAALFAWVMLSETMSFQNLFGMILTIIGIALVILNRKKHDNEELIRTRLRLSYSAKGILFALAGAVGQAIGLVFSKYGMQDFDAFAASQIRVLAGFIGYFVWFIFFSNPVLLKQAIRDRKAMMVTIIGTIFGPFLGVAFSLLAIQNANMGVTSTIMAITPVLIIPISLIIFKEKITLKEIIGASIAVLGVALFFL